MKKITALPFLSTSFSESGKKLKDRISNILNTKKRKTGAALLLAVIAAAALAGGFAAVNGGSGDLNNIQAEPIAVIGNDGRGTSDIILVLKWDNRSKTLNVIQVPRDTQTSTGGKFGAAHRDGVLFSELALLGFETDNLVTVGYDAFRKAVDAVGGIETDVPVDMRYSDPYQGLEINLDAGRQLLDGEHAEMLIRYRKGSDGSEYVNGDMDRLLVQSSFYSLFIDKFLDTELSGETFSDLVNSVDTTMTPEEIAAYAELIGSIENIDIKFLPGTSEVIDGIQYFVPQKEHVSLVDFWGTPPPASAY